MMSVRWITFEEAESLPAPWPREELQPIELSVDRPSLLHEIPIAPRRLESDGLFMPYPVDSWYCTIDSRVIVLELDAHEDSIIIARPFRKGDAVQHDWESLKELLALPRSIDVLHPVFIGSRAKQHTHFVYRRQPAGWDSPLYRAASLEDAESLLAYLHKTPGNESCFIGEPEIRGEWEVIANQNGNEVLIACYPERSTSLSFACTFTAKERRTAPLMVQNRTRIRADEQYVVANGRVIEAD